MIEHPPKKLHHLTVDDFARHGACVDGVREFRDRHAPGETAASVASLLEIRTKYRLLILETAGLAGPGYIFSNVSGPGSGYGDGDGDGSSYGFSDGSGSGYGSGYGDSSGGGYGLGYGYSDLYGSGYGYGYGCGYGCGYGDGDGDGEAIRDGN